MRISINVLPDEQKSKIKEEKRIGFALKLGFSFVTTLLLLNAALFLMQGILGIEYQAAKKSSGYTLTGSGAEEDQLEKIFQDTNSQVSALGKINSNIPNWARVLAKISELCPDEVRLKQISADNSHLKISGFSKTRDAFLSFQDKLKNEGFQFPVDISNLVASDNFDFDLEITVPENYLIRK